MDKLPEELRLHILSYLPSSDLWLSVRHINQRYSRYADDVACKNLVPKFTVSLRFTLGSGSSHRWYDVRGSVHQGFKEISKLNPQYALFEIVTVHPESYHDRVMQDWKRMCASGFGEAQEWLVTFRGTGLLMKMRKHVLSAEDGIWCDWRELLDGYYARLPQVWEGLARPVT